MKKLIKSMMAVLLTMTVLAGCGSSASNDTTKASSTESAAVSNEAASAEEAATEGGTNIKIGIEANVSTLDNNVIDTPSDFLVVRAMQDGLYEQTDKEIRLALAESVDVNEDGTEYIFHLRDAKYSDGNPIVAGDFVYSWQRLVNPDTGSEYAWYAGAAGIKNADAVAYEGAELSSLGVTAIDDKTLKVELDHAVPFFDAILTMPCFAPVEQAFGEEHGDLYGQSVDDIVSSGPYVVDSWTVGGGDLRLVKNPEYWNKDAISVDSLTFITVKDEQSGILAYESGSLDVVTISGDLVEQYKDSAILDTQLSPQVYYIYINHENENIANLNVRRALAYAVNKAEIADSILKDGSKATGYIVPEAFAFDSNGKSYREQVSVTDPNGYDVDKAKAAWDEAKAELGDTISLELLYDDVPTSKNIAQYLKSSLEGTLEGLTIELREVPYEACWDEQKAGNFDLTVSSWMADYIDPSMYIDILNSTYDYNLGNYSNPDYDVLDNAAANELATDPVKRAEAYGKAEQIALDDVGIIPLYQVSSASLIREGIDVKFAPFGSYVYRYATVNK
ncbi:MAG: peptide ABC transporter substrate-binding protein [Lachnospiraceae bacterium]|nr:peptide ABC transporter substrate-binding protein [Lachnospiraceae bacterium]